MEHPQEPQDRALNPGTIDPHDSIADDIVARFREGRAAEFVYNLPTPRTGGSVPVSIMLIPEPLIRDTGTGLLIVVEGRGSLMWYGNDRANAFVLVANGIRPLGLAAELASVLNKVVERLTPHTPLLTNQTTENDDGVSA